ncbi:MAG: hypothetical protein WCH39_24915 [Schlesneria sp.]
MRIRGFLQLVASPLPLGISWFDTFNRERHDTTPEAVASCILASILALRVSIACRTNGVWIELSIQQHAISSVDQMLYRPVRVGGKRKHVASV